MVEGVRRGSLPDALRTRDVDQSGGGIDDRCPEVSQAVLARVVHPRHHLDGPGHLARRCVDDDEPALTRIAHQDPAPDGVDSDPRTGLSGDRDPSEHLMARTVDDHEDAGRVPGRPLLHHPDQARRRVDGDPPESGRANANRARCLMGVGVDHRDGPRRGPTGARGVEDTGVGIRCHPRVQARHLAREVDLVGHLAGGDVGHLQHIGHRWGLAPTPPTGRDVDLAHDRIDDDRADDTLERQCGSNRRHRTTGPLDEEVLGRGPGRSSGGRHRGAGARTRRRRLTGPRGRLATARQDQHQPSNEPPAPQHRSPHTPSVAPRGSRR